MENQEKLAVIRIRGDINLAGTIKDTLKMLRLYRKNYCVVVPNNKSYAGMIKKAKDYITWGEVTDETYTLILDKRGEEYLGREGDLKGKIKYNKFITVNNKKLKPYFRLNMPRGGFERKGIKVPYNSGGALGYRGNEINSLIKRMI